MCKISSGFYGTDEDDLEEFYDDLDDEEAGQCISPLILKTSQAMQFKIYCFNVMQIQKA